MNKLAFIKVLFLALTAYFAYQMKDVYFPDKKEIKSVKPPQIKQDESNTKTSRPRPYDFSK
jgi:hypothetical protein